MTTKRFELMSDDEIIIDNCSISDDGGKQTYWIVEYEQRVKVVELLNWLHSRNKRLEEKIQRERTSFMKTHERWSKEAETKIKELAEENEQLKKALWCIRKRYGYTVEEFIEDLKDNGIDLTKVDLE